MVDIGTGLTVWGSKDFLLKILGPTADYLGEKTLGLTKKADINLTNIFKNAEKKLIPEKHNKGQVPTRVLGQIIINGSFCDDEIGAEYFGGVLASSKSEINRDDRGTSISALIGRLSAYDLRAHYLFYHSFKQLYQGRKVNTKSEQGLNLLTYFNLNSLHLAMEFSQEEMNSREAILATSLKRLSNEGLLAENVRIGPPGITGLDKRINPEIKSEGIWIFPSLLGIDLFMWAHGHGGEDTDSFFDKKLTVDLLEGIKHKPEFSAVKIEFKEKPRELLYKRVYKFADGLSDTKYYYDQEGMHSIPDEDTALFLNQTNEILGVEKEEYQRFYLKDPIDTVLKADLIEVEGTVHVILNNKSYYVNSWGYPTRWGKSPKDLKIISVDEFKKFGFGF